jgi:formylglycine-generating enzyme required for sulfatase activity
MKQVWWFCAFGLTATISLVCLEVAAQSGDRPAILQRLMREIVVTKITADRSDIVTAGSLVALRKEGLLMYGVVSPAPPSNTYKDGKISQGWGGFGRNLLINMASAAGGNSAGYPARNFVAGETCWVTGISVEKDGVVFQLYSDPYDGIRYYADLKIPFPQKKVVPPVDTVLEMAAEILEARQPESPEDEQVPAAATTDEESPPAVGDASEEEALSQDDILRAIAGTDDAASDKRKNKPANSSGKTPTAQGFTNKDVIKLVKTGRGDKYAIGKIRSMPGDDLDTSTEALIQLKKAGVSKAVIEAMLARTAGSILVYADSPIDLEIDGKASGSLSGTLETLGQKTFTLTPGKHIVKAVSRELHEVHVAIDVEIRKGGQPKVIQAMVANKVIERKAARRAEEATRIEKETAQKRVKELDLRWVSIPAGKFRMGCSSGDSYCGANEKPAHNVRITRPIQMMATLVTAGQFRTWAFSEGHEPPEQPKWSAADVPVVNVTWGEAKSFCSAFGGRLPTEAEWEYAARGGTEGDRYGSLDSIAWYADNSGRDRLDTTNAGPQGLDERLRANGDRAHPVGMKRPNAFGLYDMLGNVWAWCADWYGAEYYKEKVDTDPGGLFGAHRVVRGGSWTNVAKAVRVSYRGALLPSSRYDYVGFRCVRDADSTETLPSVKTVDVDGAPTSQPSRLERVVPFRTGESIPLGIVEGLVTVSSLRITGWPKPEKLQKAENRPTETTKLAVKFTYANPDKKTWKCQYRVAVLDEKGEEVGFGEREVDLDKRQTADTNGVDVTMRTLDFPRAAKLSVSVRTRPD